MIFLQGCLRWAWAAFAFERQIVDQYRMDLFRAIVGVADTADAFLRDLGAGWTDQPDGFDQPRAFEDHMLLLEDLDEWPDDAGIKDMVTRFGARLDLAFCGNGKRHLDRTGPEEGQLNLR